MVDLSINQTTGQTTPTTAKPVVGVHLRCCNVYIHLHPNAVKDAFVGFCPRCAAPVRVPIVAHGGSTGRIFTT